MKPIAKNAEIQFDYHMKLTTGINLQLMLLGDYSRVLFDEKNENHVLALIPNADHPKKLSILTKFRKLRKVYRSKNTCDELPNETTDYKSVAIEMGKEIIQNFHYVQWHNY